MDSGSVSYSLSVTSVVTQIFIVILLLAIVMKMYTAAASGGGASKQGAKESQNNSEVKFDNVSDTKTEVIQTPMETSPSLTQTQTQQISETVKKIKSKT